MFQIRKFVSGCSSNGRAIVEFDELVKPVTIAAQPGVRYYPIWGSNEPTAQVGDGARPISFEPYFPPPGGIRFMLLSWPPKGGLPAKGDLKELFAEMEMVFPGLLDAVRGDENGRHATDSVDMVMVLDGEIWLELDDGTETLLSAGHCVVQRGAKHAWHNRSDKNALMALVVVGAERKTS